MNIISARFNCFDHSVVTIDTVEVGEVLVVLNTPDNSGGWQLVYAEWATTNITQPYIPPEQTI